MQVGDASEGFTLRVNKCCKFTQWVPTVPTHWKVSFHCTVCCPFLENGQYRAMPILVRSFEVSSNILVSAAEWWNSPHIHDKRAFVLCVPSLNKSSAVHEYSVSFIIHVSDYNLTSQKNLFSHTWFCIIFVNQTHGCNQE